MSDTSDIKDTAEYLDKLPVEVLEVLLDLLKAQDKRERDLNASVH